MPPWNKSHKSKLKATDDLTRRSVYDNPPLFMSRQASTKIPNLPHPQIDQGIFNQSLMHNLSQKHIQASKWDMSIHLIPRKADLIVLDQKSGEKKLLNSQQVLINDKGQLMLSDLINTLKKTDIQFLDKAIISVLNTQETQEQSSISNLPVYTYCGNDPLPDNYSIAVDLTQPIEIKARSTKSTLLDQMLEEQNITNEKEPVEENKAFARVKERKISEVIEKVALWRRFYTGFYDDNHKFVQMPLNEAADKVKISKKTLDDYLLQIRCGKRYGFDFNNSKNERIGKLRSFVKDKKKTHFDIKSIKKDEE